jgi:hypothetical protein
MKKILVFALPTLFFLSCGSEEQTESSTNSSSIIAVENPADELKVETKKVKVETPENNGPTTSIEFLEEEFHFGNVFYPSENMHTFKFKNTGDAPLVIESAKASCGCTIPNKPEEPIAPGEIGELDVIFRPKEGQAGSPVTKKITVVANTEPRETYINIKADVLKGM